ncbi:pectate lyase [Terrimonas sp. NA20]|uniref:Pectate lyase n=1 Tax=Terrimonas ginsenosidimutans TaxID=2908004 RepID=A0ABS9KNC4_9BACT|nr:pectate lyase [Terrimonas ginsenosidimutans]MCG2613813.1 pectate lyase [Terrimonas ginsenosidimutans]
MIVFRAGKLIASVVILMMGLKAGAQVVSFPGAEGFGKYTTGGRGGRVYVVSNLEDDGEGSLRQAVEAKHPRIVVFAVSGTIHLKSRLLIAKNVTIAGQTAPEDGICIADHPVSLNGDNIIVRYLRFRMGDRYQNKGMIDGAGADDAFGGNRKKNIVIDHCSISWSTDEVFSVYGGDSTTLQWNIISEPLNYSYHFETGDKDFEHHGYGGIWGGRHLSAHHNLLAHCVSRNPRFNGVRTKEDAERVDYRNNVIYNWGHNNVYGGEGGQYNLVNNYYKYGPATSKSVQSRIVNPSRQEKPFIDFGQFYVNGNYVDGAKDVSANNLLGVHMGKGFEQEKGKAVVSTSFESIEIPGQSAKEAYECILQCAGASFPVRDTLDARIINDVKNRTGRMIDVQGGYPHGTPYEQTISAWPALKEAKGPLDSDNDGMPDEWEKKNGLNPKDPTDATGFTLNKQYTNIEVYINSLVASVK